MRKRYYCFNCKAYFVGHATCFHCSKRGKHVGYELKVSMSNAKLNNQEQRKQHRKNLTQPYRDGAFSAEFKEYFPDKAKQMVKEGVITQKQYDKAKPVWKDKADII